MLIALFQQLFPGSEITEESDFFDLGGDSLALVTFCSDLEGKLGREVHPTLVLLHPTVIDLSEALFETS